MALVNWAYVAGFFDGEGCVCAAHRGLNISVSQKELDALYNVQLFLAAHGIKSVISRAGKGVSALVVTQRKGQEKFLASIRPYVVARKQVTEDGWRHVRMFPAMTPTQIGLSHQRVNSRRQCRMEKLNGNGKE